MSTLVDVNYDIFGRGDGEETFFEIDEVVEIAEHASVQTSAETPGLRDMRLLTPPVFYSLSEGIADNRRINDAMLGAAARLGGRAAGVAEPKFGRAAVEEIQRISAQGAVAAVFSPRAQGVFGNDGLMFEICSQAAGLGMLTLIRSAPYSINESLPRIWDLARACPDARLVVLGAFASWENIQLVRWNGGGPVNVSYDLSGLVETHDLIALIEDLGPARLLFGSGGPANTASLLALIRSCARSEPDLAAILSGNATELLELVDEDPS